jgi:hypothetical protein
MKYLLVLLAAVILTVSGCGRDPVAEDLIAFDKVGSGIVDGAMVKDLNQRMRAAETNEERAALMGELAGVFDGMASKFTTFEAKSPEVAKYQSDIKQSLMQAGDGARQAQTALLHSDPLKLNDASRKISDAQQQLLAAFRSIKALAKEHKVEFSK